MRLAARSFLVAFIVAGMLNPSALAAPAKPLGMVVSAEKAHLGETAVAMGTNVFGGDYLQTEPNGSLRAKVGPSQIYLGSASGAVLQQDGDKIAAKLTQGTIGFSSAVANQFEIDTPIGTVRPEKGQAFGEVTLVSPKTILVAAYKGSLVVSSNGIERTIPQGNAYNVTFADANDPQNQGGGTSAGGNGNGRTVYSVSNHGQVIFTIIVLAAAAGGAYAAWRLANDSDSTPQQ